MSEFSSSMLRINGRDVPCESATPLADCLRTLGVDPRAVAVEIDGEIIQRAQMEATVLRPGQVVEIVRMVGGGRPPGSAEAMSLTSRENSPENAAQEAVDKDRRLPGEPLDTELLEDAIHWTRVYGELLKFKADIIGQSTAAAATMGAVARHEVESTDLVILERERRRFEGRFQYWKLRSAELAHARQPSH